MRREVLISLHQLAAGLYLAAGVTGAAGLALPTPRARRIGVGLLAAGAFFHLTSFGFLHRHEPVPQLTDFAAVVSLITCLSMLAFLVFLRRARWDALVAAVAPVGFLGAFFAALRLPHVAGQGLFASGHWPHAHVILASAGLALLGVAGLAGVVFLREARNLKRKRLAALGAAREGSGDRWRLPSLETLDRVNVMALAIGFPLLTLGVVTGMIWVEGMSGRVWTGTAHQIWTTLAWVIYATLVCARFLAHQSARNAAASAIGGFAFLVFAVIGVGLVT